MSWNYKKKDIPEKCSLIAIFNKKIIIIYHYYIVLYNTDQKTKPVSLTDATSHTRGVVAIQCPQSYRWIRFRIHIINGFIHFKFTESYWTIDWHASLFILKLESTLIMGNKNNKPHITKFNSVCLRFLSCDTRAQDIIPKTRMLHKYFLCQLIKDCSCVDSNMDWLEYDCSWYHATVYIYARVNKVNCYSIGSNI